MRYFLVRYLRQPNGQMDEIVEVSKKLRPRDHSFAAVILDFDKRSVEKAHLDGITVPKDFTRIRDFYYRHYPRVIDQLESARLTRTAISPDTSPGSN